MACIRTSCSHASAYTARMLPSLPLPARALKASSGQVPSSRAAVVVQNQGCNPLLKVARKDRIRAAHLCASSAIDSAAPDSDKDFAIALAKIADDTKCQDIVLLDVAPVVSWTSYMLIVTVISRPQLFAVMARMEKMADEMHDRRKQNAPGSSPWEVLDFGEVVVQVFTAEQREYYDIESFYATAEEVDLPFTSEPPLPSVPQWTTKF